MENLDTCIEFVKQQIEFQTKMVKKFYGESYRENLHRTAVARFHEILSILRQVRDLPDAPTEPAPRAPISRRNIMLSLADIKDIPPELLEELNLSEADKQEMLIESIIADAGGVLSLDKLLVEMFHRTGQVFKRTVVISRLYRMGSRGLIYNLPSKKGLYSTTEMSQADVKRLFGQLDPDGEMDAPSATVTPLAS